MMYPLEKEPERLWWTFYPFCGIDITNARHDLRTPVFGDVSFLSKRHIPQVVKLLRFEQPDHAQKVIRWLEEIAEADFAKTFLAVRRKGVVPENYDETPIVMELSRERAYDVASLLAVVTLASGTKKYIHTACGLAEQIYRATENLAMVDIDGRAYSTEIGGRNALSPFSAVVDEPMSRAALKQLLVHRPFRPLTEIVLTKKSALPDTVRKSLKQAVLRLADAIHAPTDTAQLLGAVIVLELLFSANDGQKYDVYRERIIAFLGQETAQPFDLNALFKARHGYVHQGQEVADGSVAYRALVLALLCVVRYANAVGAFASKQDFMDYLDMLYRVERRTLRGDAMKTKALQRLLQHDRNGFVLPFGP